MKEEKLLKDYKEKNVENLIYRFREMHVMLDTDVAFFFNTTVSNLNRQMKRNIERFPEDFCFQLSTIEMDDLRCQNGTTKLLSSKRRYNPYVYTEEGIIALAGVLNNETAARASIEISRKFVEMRKMFFANSELLLMASDTKRELLEFENETNQKFDELYRWKEEKGLPKDKVISEGKYFDAFEFIPAIIKEAKDNIVLVDPYCDSKALVFLNNKNKDVSLTIYKGQHSKLKEEETKIFEAQNGSTNVVTKNPLHDRFLIIDQKQCFLLGSSLNNAGKSLLTITKIELDGAKKQIIEEYPLLTK